MKNSILFASLFVIASSAPAVADLSESEAVLAAETYLAQVDPNELRSQLEKAPTLSCKVNVDEMKDTSSFQLLIYDQLEANCQNQFRMTIYGIGVGLRYTTIEGVGLFCLGGIHEGTYYGVKADAGLLFGLGFAAFAGKKGGLCFLAGGELFSFGAGASISKLTLKKIASPSPTFR